jgi:hypothetical protein
MEDYELARRMKRAGRVAFLPLTVRTSGRRFLAKGVIRTAMINWLIILAYHCGVSPERLARWYRGESLRVARAPLIRLRHLLPFAKGRRLPVASREIQSGSLLPSALHRGGEKAAEGG